MKTKIAIILAALLLAASMAACGNKNNEETTTSNKIDINNENSADGTNNGSENATGSDQTPGGNVEADEIKNPGEYTYTVLNEAEKIQVLSATGAANLRTADHAIVTSVSNGTQLDRIGISNGSNGYWSKVMYNGEECYIASHLITTIINLDEGFVEVNKTLIKNDGSLNVRLAPEMGAEIIGHVSSGDTVTVVAENTTIGWYKISFVPYGETEATFGYIASDAKYFESESAN